MQTAASALQKDSLPVVGNGTVFLIMALVVCAASLSGILTRPVGFLAALWPANAVLLGLMVRNPQYNNVWEKLDWRGRGLSCR